MENKKERKKKREKRWRDDNCFKEEENVGRREWDGAVGEDAER